MKTVIEMAREAGCEQVDQDVEEWVCYTDELERFAELVRADERNSWPAEMEAMERQVNILTDALAQSRNATLDEIAAKIEAMPFGDTAASFAVWIREQKT